LTATDVDQDAVTAARQVHSASRYLLPRLAPELPGLLATARQAGVVDSVDTNDDPAGAWADLDGLLSVADVALPNDRELAAWASALGAGTSADWLDDARAVGQRVPTVVVKGGPEGGALVTNGIALVQPASPVDVVDTTGAGDSFDAGWIAATLRGADPPDALRWAVAAGGLSTRGSGGTACQGDADEVAAAADALPPALHQDPTSRGS
jgi:sugar/nucleoside kinase (ribokinase family)